MVGGRGLFVTFEGGEGAGKTTLIGTLSAWLRGNGREVLVTREPGGSPLAERARALLLSGSLQSGGPEVEAVVFALARADHLSSTIMPALDRGAVVLCDRFFDSTRAYQGASGGVGPDLLDSLEEEAAGRRRPDLTLILDLPVDIGHARASARRGADAADRFEGAGRAFHEAVRQGFLAVAASSPSRCRVIDASASPEAVAQAAMGHLGAIIGITEASMPMTD